MNVNSAIITPVLAAGSSESPYYYQVNISQMLCSPSCVGITPVFNPQFSVLSVSNVGTGQYVVTVHVEGIIGYVPCNGDCCCTRSQVLSQNFTIPIASTTAPGSVTIAAGTAISAVAAAPCQTCSRSFVCECPLTVTVG